MRSLTRAPGTWNPVVDGVSLTALPINLIAAKTFNRHVPVIIGSVRDEQVCVWCKCGAVCVSCVSDAHKLNSDCPAIPPVLTAGAFAFHW